MKIIFSRKGFDSGYGGVASPIFEDGSFVSLPIPSRFGRPLADISFRGLRLGDLVHTLTGGRHHAKTHVHLDPDLHYGSTPRIEGWKPAFGQVSSALTHLKNQAVDVGDIFLFFGWFRKVKAHGKQFNYETEAPDIHSMFGWLQVGEVLEVTQGTQARLKHRWLAEHPHVAHAPSIGSPNRIYIASDVLTIEGKRSALPGGGAFDRWSPELQLTSSSSSLRSIWDLPGWAMPGAGLPSALTYHSDPNRWAVRDGRARLQTVAKGQEFVLDVGTHAAAHSWVRALIASHSGQVRQ